MNQQRLIQSFDKFYGRTEELQKLRAALKNARDPEKPAQVVFVRGSSGTGKSTLIARAYSTEKNLLLGQGKFEEKRNPKPYAALVNSSSSICQEISFLDEDTKAKYKASLGEQLGDAEIKTLVDLLPHFSFLMDADKRSRRKSIGVQSKEGLDKLKYTLRLFFRSVCLVDRPVVLCLDDLQWIDPATLDLLKFLLRDSGLKHHVFVASYRDNEVHSDHMVAQWLHSLTTSETLVPPQVLTIGDLNIELLGRLVSDLLRVDEVDELATLIHNRTNGNVFHVLQLIDFLQAEGLLEYSLSSFRWTWDIDNVRDHTVLSENVVDVVSHKLNRLSIGVKECLKLCSCIGFRFEEDIAMLVKDFSPNENLTDLGECLQIAIDEGLLERASGKRIKFAHDKIFEAASHLFTAEDDRLRVHKYIGDTLLKHFGCDRDFDALDDRVLFLCTDQLNRSRSLISDKSFSVTLADLNCVAGQRAELHSAFIPAVEYFQVGVSLLDQATCWTDNYSLSLELFTSLAEMSYCASQFGAIKPAVDTVVDNSKSINDCLRVYLVVLAEKAARGTPMEVIETSLSVLRKLGEDIPSNPGNMYTRRVLEKTKRSMFALSEDEIQSLKKMESVRKAAIVNCLTGMFFNLYQSGRYNLSIVCSCRAVQVTVEHGMAPLSPTAFAMLGNLLMTSRDVESGWRLSSHAKALFDSLDKTERSCTTLYMSCQVFHFREPLTHCLNYWLEGYEVGMRTGAIEAAFRCFGSYVMHYHLAGLPLGPLLSDMKNFTNLMDEYGQRAGLMYSIALYQCVLNLTGNSDDVLHLSKGRTAYYRKKLDWDGKMGLETEWSYQMQMAFYCENIDLATEMYNKLTVIDSRSAFIMPFYHNRVFFFTMIACWNAKRLGKRKYRQDAKKYYGIVEELVTKHGAINLVHKLQILKAEMMTLQKKKESAIRSAFDEAIVQSTKAGFLQDAAVAAHIASRAFQDDEAQSMMYFQRAREFYESWGANGLVEYLTKSVQGGPLDSPVNESNRPGFRSRERFDKTIADEHKKLQIKE